VQNLARPLLLHNRLEEPTMSEYDKLWKPVCEWLRTKDAEYFVDAAVLGSLPAWEAEELLIDHDIAVSPASLRRLGLEIDAAIQEGA
jgi:hypothetical protein